MASTFFPPPPSRRSPTTRRPRRLRSVPLRQSERAIKRPKRNLPSVPVESLVSRAYKATGLEGFPVAPGNFMTSEGVNLRHFKNIVRSQVETENARRARAMNVRRDEAARRIQRLWRAGTAKPGLKGHFFGQTWAYNPAMIRHMNAWSKALNNFNKAVSGTSLEQWYRTNQGIQQVRSNLRNRRLTNQTGWLVEGYQPKKNKYTVQNVVAVLGLTHDPRIQEIPAKAARTLQRYRRAQIMKRQLTRLGSLRQTPLPINEKRNIFKIPRSGPRSMFNI